MCSRRCPRAVAAPRAKLLCVVSSCTGRIKIIQPSEFQLWQCPNYVTCRLVSSSRPPELCMWMRGDGSDKYSVLEWEELMEVYLEKRGYTGSGNEMRIPSQ
ncbi:hypothetical protein J4Q44_G00386720 [Coregonus suidteri]|uniref:Uncharacterized protein n=1 Tax=Coregonus suidteri TaxID=861788 RepID=A0AAN8KLC3_9TELE